MKKDDWSKMITAAKKEDKPDGVLTIAEDPVLRLLALLWPTIRIENRVMKARSMADLWRGVRISYYELAEATGLPPRKVMWGVDILRAARMIYPDGTLHPELEEHFRQRAKKYLGLEKTTTRQAHGQRVKRLARKAKEELH